jgi:GTP1/Obg family GTP-binding protein
MPDLTKEAIADTLKVLTRQNEATIDNCISSLQRIKESKKISETNLRELINVWRELDALRELFYVRLLNSLKRGDMV